MGIFGSKGERKVERQFGEGEVGSVSRGNFFRELYFIFQYRLRKMGV